MTSLRALLQFTTILPLGKPADFDSFAKRSWLYPIAGYVTGLIAALPALAAWYLGFENSSILAALTLALVVFITGANHFDGLLDFGDGLMAHGSREKRIRAMTDRTTGAGALALGIMVVLISYAALSSMTALQIAFAVFIAEVFGKMTMGLFSALGKPFHDGIQKYIYDLSKRRFCIYTILLTLPLFLLPAKMYIGAGLITALITFLCLLLLARKLFGGVNGDVTGAGNELTRMTVLLICAILLVSA
jgi:adenosylcobinamide-GDP ribazoletransferase